MATILGTPSLTSIPNLSQIYQTQKKAKKNSAGQMIDETTGQPLDANSIFATPNSMTSSGRRGLLDTILSQAQALGASPIRGKTLLGG